MVKLDLRAAECEHVDVNDDKKFGNSIERSTKGAHFIFDSLRRIPERETAFHSGINRRVGGIMVRGCVRRVGGLRFRDSDGQCAAVASLRLSPSYFDIQPPPI